MNLQTPIQSIMATNDCSNEAATTLRSKITESLSQFIFEPLTEHTIQDVKNTIAVQLMEVSEEFQIMELAFNDSQSNALEFDVVVTPFAVDGDVTIAMSLSASE